MTDTRTAQEMVARLNAHHGCWRIWDGEHIVFTSLPEQAATLIASQAAEIERLRAANAAVALELRDCRILSNGHRQNAEEHLRDRQNAEARALTAEAALAKVLKPVGLAGIRTVTGFEYTATFYFDSLADAELFLDMFRACTTTEKGDHHDG